MVALVSLYVWRDAIARQEDESVGYMLPNHMMISIADKLSTELDGILACCQPTPPIVKQQLNDIHRLVMDTKTVPSAKATVAVADGSITKASNHSNHTLPPPLPPHPSAGGSASSPPSAIVGTAAAAAMVEVPSSPLLPRLKIASSSNSPTPTNEDSKNGATKSESKSIDAGIAISKKAAASRAGSIAQRRNNAGQ